MEILGIDYSINSPGLVKFELDKDLNIISQDYRGFTQSKKFESKKILYFKKDQFKCNIDQTLWIHSQLFSNFLHGVIDYVAFEGYAFGISKNGRVFDIAEACGNLKWRIYTFGSLMRIYDPNSIKMFATSHGLSKKEEMEVAYEQQSDKIDLSFLPMVSENKNGNPKDNIIDAWWIAKLLLTELRLRRGLVMLKDLSEDAIKIFNRVTKSNPTNILATDFLDVSKIV